jgi:hypothetical protein
MMVCIPARVSNCCQRSIFLTGFLLPASFQPFFFQVSRQIMMPPRRSSESETSWTEQGNLSLLKPSIAACSSILCEVVLSTSPGSCLGGWSG